MAKKIQLCKISEIEPGEMLRVDVDGAPPIAVYNLNGEFYATSNICTHATAMLTDGYLDGDIVECPVHGGTFNVRSGAAVDFPCEVALKTYEVAVEDGYLTTVME